MKFRSKVVAALLVIVAVVLAAAAAAATSDIVVVVSLVVVGCFIGITVAANAGYRLPVASRKLQVARCSMLVAACCTFIKYKIFLHGIWKTTCSLELLACAASRLVSVENSDPRDCVVSAKCD